MTPVPRRKRYPSLIYASAVRATGKIEFAKLIAFIKPDSVRLISNSMPIQFR